jgi:hypothetical protein
MNNIELFLVIMLYLALLFFIAFWAEKRKSNFWANNPYVYSLSLASIAPLGRIMEYWRSGQPRLEYLAIYIGQSSLFLLGL